MTGSCMGAGPRLLSRTSCDTSLRGLQEEIDSRRFSWVSIQTSSTCGVSTRSREGLYISTALRKHNTFSLRSVLRKLGMRHPESARDGGGLLSLAWCTRGRLDRGRDLAGLEALECSLTMGKGEPWTSPFAYNFVDAKSVVIDGEGLFPIFFPFRHCRLGNLHRGTFHRGG